MELLLKYGVSLKEENTLGEERALDILKQAIQSFYFPVMDLLLKQNIFLVSELQQALEDIYPFSENKNLSSTQNEEQYLQTLKLLFEKGVHPNFVLKN